MTGKRLWLFILCFGIIAISQTPDKLTCDELLHLHTDDLVKLSLAKNPSIPPENIPDECFKALLNASNVTELAINYYILTRKQVCQILRNKPELKTFSLNHNFLDEFNMKCVAHLPKLTKLEISNNRNIAIVGRSQSILEFVGVGNAFDEFPLDGRWDHLEYINLRDSNSLAWNTTFHEGDFPKLKHINDLPKEDFLKKINYNYYEKKENQRTEDASTTTPVISTTTTKQKATTSNVTNNTTKAKQIQKNVEDDQSKPAQEDNTKVGRLPFIIFIALVALIVIIFGLYKYLKHRNHGSSSRTMPLLTNDDT